MNKKRMTTADRLIALLRSEDRVFSSGEIIASLWSEAVKKPHKYLRVVVSQLRSRGYVIYSKQGVGYSLAENALYKAPNRLSVQQQLITKALRNTSLTGNQLIRVLYPNPDNQPDTAYPLVMRQIKRLRAMGFEIGHSRGRGYFLNTRGDDRCNALVPVSYGGKQ